MDRRFNSFRSYVKRDRYDVEIIRVEGHEADTRRWVTLAEVTRLLHSLQDGDDMLVHHVGSAEPELEYG